MMPQTVPNKPMNGETEPVVASQDMPFSARRTSSEEASCIFTRSLLSTGIRVSHLILQLAISGGIDGGEGRAGRGERLRIRNAAGSAEDAQELIALAADAAEQTELLQDQAPGYDGEEQEERENAASDHAGFLKNIAEVDE